MTPSAIEIRITEEDRRIAHLTAMAVGLALVDAAIPSPLPGVKPGLANIVTLMVLLRYGWSTAAWVTGLRVVASSLLLGQFLAPGFLLSVAGASASLLALSLCQRLPSAFGPVTLSLLAAFAHLGGQLILARAWLIPHDGLFYMLPLLSLSALIFGTINGLIVSRLLAEPPPKEIHHA